MSIFYLDPVNGSDSAASPLGWWSVNFTAGSGNAPTADTVMSNNGQSAKLTVLTPQSGSWGAGTEAGIFYFYGKTGAFAAGSITWTGGSATIAGDATYCAWLTITGGPTAARIAAGDTIRILKSPDPVSLGVTGTFTPVSTVGGTPGTLSITGAVNNGSGLIRLTVPTTTLVSGDIVQVLGVSGTLEANGVWKCTVIDATHLDLQNSAFVNAYSGSGATCRRITWKAVTLNTNLTKQIDTCDVAWSPDNSSTVSLVAYTSDAKEGSGCAQIVKSSPANSTLYAHRTIPSTNFSAYQQVSFWIKNATAITAGQWKLCLCSDTAGATVVDTIPIPAIPSTGQWVPLVISRNSGGNLGSAIQSVALWSGASAGTTAGIKLDNIIACATGSLNLQTLISLNSTVRDTSEAWYGIQSIDPTGTIILLDNHTNAICNTGRGYSGAGGTGTLYGRTCLQPLMAATASATVNYQQRSGTAGNLVYFEGGFSQTTNTQNGETWVDGQNGFGDYIYQNTGGGGGGAVNYGSFNYLSFARYNVGIYIGYQCGGHVVNNTNAMNCTSYGYYTYQGSLGTINIGNCCNGNGSIGMYQSGSAVASILNTSNHIGYGYSTLYQGTGGPFGNITNCNNNSSGGFNLTESAGTVGTITNANYNGGYGVILGSNYVTVTAVTNALYNTSGGVQITGSANTIGTLGTMSYNGGAGVYFYGTGSTGHSNSVGIITAANNNTGAGIYFNGAHSNFIGSVGTSNNNTQYGINFAASTNNVINSISTTGNSSSSYWQDTGTNYVHNATNAEGTLCNAVTSFVGSRLCLDKFSTGYGYIWTDFGIISSKDGPTYGHTGSGICWNLKPTNSVRSITYPLRLKVATIACVANKLVTVSIWCRLTSTTTVAGKLSLRANQILGDANCTNGVTLTTNLQTTYQQLSISFTPSESGMVDIEFLAYWLSGAGYTDSVYVDDMTISIADTTYINFSNMDQAIHGTPFVTNYNVNAGGGGGTDIFGWIG